MINTLQLKDHQKRTSNLQDYIFKTEKFLKDNSIKFSKNKLRELNEKIIKIENKDDFYSEIVLIDINEEINEYIIDCAIDCLFEDFEKIDEYLENILFI